MVSDLSKKKQMCPQKYFKKKNAKTKNSPKLLFVLFYFTQLKKEVKNLFFFYI